MLDYLSVADLVRSARVSKRMREMVYDDTRWVQRLRAMGCWNEAEARAKGEELRRKKLEALQAPQRDFGSMSLLERSTANSGMSQRTISINQCGGSIPQLDSEDLGNSLQPDSSVDGFDVITLSSASAASSRLAQTFDNNAILDIMQNARSIRGAARGEYGRIHAALRPFYKDAVRSKHPSNAKIFRVYRDPNQQAQMLSQLIRFAKSDFTQGRVQREKRLAFMVAAFEDAVSREYEQGLKIGDVDGRMKKYAHVLVTLNGGQRAIDRFLSENILLKDSMQLGDPMDCISPSSPDSLFLEESHGFFGHLSAAFNSQIDIIQRVFPPSVDVVIPLLARVGVEIITPYLRTLFEYVQGKSAESFIRAVSGTYEQCLQFANSLHPVPRSMGAFRESLDNMIIDIYESYAGRYLEEELAFFRRRSETEVTGWERQLSQQDASIESLYMSNVNRQADKRDFLSSFKKVVMAPVNALPTFQFGVKSNTNKLPPNGEKLEPPRTISSQNSSRSSTPAPTSESRAPALSRAPSPFKEPPSTELAAKAAIMKSRLEGIKLLFSLEVALNLVHMAKTSIERTAVFAKSGTKFETNARAQCEMIFILLLKTLGSRHVRAGFDQAVDHLSKYNPRAASNRDDQPGVTPLVMFLELVNVGDLIQQMLEVFYEQELVATKLIDRNDFLSPTVKEKKRFEQMLDERVAAGLNKGIEVLMAEVEYICATTQNVEDFNPGATGMVINKLIDVSPTNTAVWIVDVVSGHTKMLVGSTDKNVLDVFNQEVGLRLFNTLCKHLKRQRISVSGSIRLIRLVTILSDITLCSLLMSSATLTITLPLSKHSRIKTCSSTSRLFENYHKYTSSLQQMPRNLRQLLQIPIASMEYSVLKKSMSLLKDELTGIK